MNSFIRKYLAYTSELETPTSFFTWGSYACVAAALRDNVYLQQRKRVVYPNIYVLLIAESGISRKSGPIITAVELLDQLKITKIIRGRSSIQAILQDLGTPLMIKTTGKQITGGSCILCADELASFFVQDPAAVPILTDIYDFRPEYESSLKGAKFTIKNNCVTMLAASNETHLREVYSNLAIYGGLVARTFFIRADEKRKGNPLFGVEANEEELLKKDTLEKQELTEALRDITKIKGVLHPNLEAQEEYKLWYLTLYNKYGSRSDKSGILARIHTGVIKLSMILAIGHDYSLEIKKEHVEEAISQCIKLLPNYELFVMSSGKADIAQAGTTLLNTLYESKDYRISRKAFLNDHWTEIDDEILTKTVDTLTGAGLVDTFLDQGNLYFELTKVGAEKMKGKLEEQK